MKNKRLFSVILVLLLALSFMFVFAGCETETTYGEWTLDKAPTVDSEGTLSRVVTKGKETTTETFTLPKLGDKAYTVKVDKAPSCGADGKTTYTITVGDKEQSFSVVTKATGAHTWSEWVVNDDFTKETRTCSVCGKTENRDYNVTYTAVDKVDATCEKTGIKAHYIGSNGKLYLDEGVSEVSETDIIIPKIALVKVDKVDATPDAVGNIEYWKCPTCGKLYRANEAKSDNVIVEADTIIPMVKVTEVAIVDASCTESGTKAHFKGDDGKLYLQNEEGKYVETTLDVLQISPLGHDWNDIAYVWADDYSSCTATRVCKRNGEHKDIANATIDKEFTEATATTKAFTTYKATFNEEWATNNSKTVYIDKTATTISAKNIVDGIIDKVYTGEAPAFDASEFDINSDGLVTFTFYNGESVDANPLHSVTDSRATLYVEVNVAESKEYTASKAKFRYRIVQAKLSGSVALETEYHKNSYQVYKTGGAYILTIGKGKLTGKTDETQVFVYVATDHKPGIVPVIRVVPFDANYNGDDIEVTLTVNKVKTMAALKTLDRQYNGKNISLDGMLTANTTATPTLSYTGVLLDNTKLADGDIPVSAGRYSVTVNYPANEIYEATSVTKAFTISPKKVTKQTIAIAKEYDIETDYTAFAIANVAIDGVYAEDTIGAKFTLEDMPKHYPDAVVTYTTVDANNYDLTAVTYDIDIAKMDVNIAIAELGREYNGEGIDLTGKVTYTDAKGRDIVGKLTNIDIKYYIESNNVLVNKTVIARNYYVNITVEANDYVNTATAKKSYVIKPKTLPVQTIDESMTYTPLIDYTDWAYTVTSAEVEGIVAGDSAIGFVDLQTGVTLIGVHEGVHVDWNREITASNYNFANVTFNFTVNKCNPTIIFNALDKKYDGIKVDLTDKYIVTDDYDNNITDYIGAPTTIEWRQVVGNETNVILEAPTDAGSYQLYIAYDGSANCEASNATCNFTISKAVSAVTIDGITGVNNGIYVYDTNEVTLDKLNITKNIPDEQFKPTYTVSQLTANGYKKISGNPLNQGTYKVDVTSNGTTNFTAYSKSITFKIVKPPHYLVGERAVQLSALIKAMGKADDGDENLYDEANIFIGTWQEVTSEAETSYGLHVQIAEIPGDVDGTAEAIWYIDEMAESVDRIESGFVFMPGKTKAEIETIIANNYYESYYIALDSFIIFKYVIKANAEFLDVGLADSKGNVVTDDGKRLLYSTATGDIALPDGVEIVSMNAFRDNSGIGKVKCNVGLRVIESFAWYNSSITEIEFTDSVKSIGQKAFGYCANLDNIKIPKTVETLGENLFDGNTSMKVYFEYKENELPAGYSQYMLLGIGNTENRVFYGVMCTATTAVPAGAGGGVNITVQFAFKGYSIRVGDTISIVNTDGSTVEAMVTKIGNDANIRRAFLDKNGVLKYENNKGKMMAPLSNGAFIVNVRSFSGTPMVISI